MTCSHTDMRDSDESVIPLQARSLLEASGEPSGFHLARQPPRPSAATSSCRGRAQSAARTTATTGGFR